MLQNKKYITDELHKINERITLEIESMEEPVRSLASYVLTAGGKRLRPLLVTLCGKAYGVDKDDGLYKLGAILELLHCATLLHDDVIDEADIRRGVPTLHTLKGPGVAVLTGDAILACAMNIGFEIDRSDIMSNMMKATVKLTKGAVEELLNCGNIDLPFDNYLRIIEAKTASIFQCAAEVGPMYTGADKEMVKNAGVFGSELGVAFQIVDDALDISSSSNIGKPIGGDLREGKVTAPLFFYLESLTQAERADFATKFSKRSLTDFEVNNTIVQMKKLNCIEKTREIAHERLKNALKALDNFPDNIERELLLEITNNMSKRLN